MKRGRISRVSKRRRNNNRKTNHTQNHYSGPSFSDLPDYVLQNILFRLPIKSIIVCKSVCTTWHDLISDPEFAKLHFDETRDRFHPLIKADKFYLLQPDRDDFEPNNVDFVFNTKSALSAFINDLLTESYSYKSRIKESCNYGPGCFLKINNVPGFANSCNGLLCRFFEGPISHAIICNPITGESIKIPECRKPASRNDSVKYGFGFSHVANKYKVVRMVAKNGTAVIGCTRVHTVGTESWRDITSSPAYPIRSNPTYFKGFLYWPASKESLSLMFFDIENECFGLDSGPADEPCIYVLVNVGILRGELCISSMTELQIVNIWAKKDSGVEKGWSKVFFYSIDLSGVQIQGSLIEPIEFLSDGSLLMFHYGVNGFIYVDPERRRFRFLKIKGEKMKVQKIFYHVPSLVSLKHSLLGLNVKVIKDLHARCGLLKLHK